MRTLTLPATLLAILALGGAAVVAQQPPPAEAARQPAPAAPAPAPEPAASKTQHQVQIDGQLVRYTATAGWLIMKNDEGKPTARFGYTAYTRDGVADVRRRPVTFAFNGGPGSSSIWLHMGVLGPRRVVVNDPGYAPPPPSERVDNPHSVLDVTDLVMIDPVGTGFSKAVGDAKNADFWGVDQDIRSVGAFIKRYVSENGRWASPKYVLGESYGGMRSAGLAYHVQSEHGMNLNGVVLVSPFQSAGSGIDAMEIDLHDASLKKFRDDLASFIRDTDRL
jgi:carboxypeptidase C (cathepsin A)